MSTTIDTSQHGQFAYIYDVFGGYETVKSMPGYVLEIGAFDGIENSNAYPLYQFGWSGTSVEPDPLSFKKLQQLHKDNPNIQTVSICLHDSDPEIVDFYGVSRKLQFNDRQLCTLSQSFSDKINNDRKVTAEVFKKLALRLHDFFNAFINVPVDYLSMDCECYDEKILLSNNFSQFRPKLIQAEFQYDTEIEAIDIAKKAAKYLKSHNYIIKRFPDRSDILAADLKCNDLNFDILKTMPDI